MKQVRLVVGDHVYMTHKTHREALEHCGIPHPIAAVRDRMSNEHQDAAGDPFVRDSANAWWKQVFDSLIEPRDEPLVQIPSTTVGVACPTCIVLALSLSHINACAYVKST